MVTSMAGHLPTLTPGKDEDGMNDPVQAQVEAYNRRDVEAFAACHAPDCVVEDGDGTVVMRGREELVAQYGPFFEASPGLHGEILSRIRVGDWVVDEEHVTGMGGEYPEVRAIAIYHVADGLIDRVRLLR
jgi:hypothetical protein